ncbi:MAG: CvpA family protein [Bacteroidetes bacterium]|nr:MAG: CvpA family protein [Bacteroidota bacterium]
MNHVDIILAIPLAIGAIRGFTRGFLLEIASLIGIIAGAFLAAMFGGMVAGVLSGYVDWNPDAIKIIAFVVVFILVIIVVKLIARIIERFFKLVGLNFLNRLAGLGAGILKIAFILSVVLIFFNYVNRNRAFMSEETQDSSYLYDKVAGLVPRLLPGSESFAFKYDLKTLLTSEEDE